MNANEGRSGHATRRSDPLFQRCEDDCPTVHGPYPLPLGGAKRVPPVSEYEVGEHGCWPLPAVGKDHD
jgi:hypothetical protein